MVPKFISIVIKSNIHTINILKVVMFPITLILASIDLSILKPIFEKEFVNFKYALELKKTINPLFFNKDGRKNYKELYVIVPSVIIVFLSLKIGFTFSIITGFIVYGSIWLIVKVNNYLKDRKIMMKIITGKKEKEWNREIIEFYFFSLRDKFSRLKFVQFLQREKITAKGHWKDGQIPYKKNDKASTLLAQLEEKWLGLDR